MAWDVIDGPGASGVRGSVDNDTATDAPENDVAPLTTGASPPPGGLIDVPAPALGLPAPMADLMLSNPQFAAVAKAVQQLIGIADPRPGLPEMITGLNVVGDYGIDPSIPLAEVARAGLRALVERAGADVADVSDVLELPLTTDRAELARLLQRGLVALEQRVPALAHLDAIDRAEAFLGAVSAWDRWARVTRPSDADGSTNSSHGVGVGLRVDEDGATRVLPLEKASPAFRAGLREGDRLVAVGGVPINDDNRVALMKQLAIDVKLGESLEVTVERAGESRTLTVTGTAWTPRSLTTKTLADGTLLVRLRSFRPQSGSELRAAVEKSAPERVILDLRSNGGGRGSSAEEIIDFFAARSGVTFAHRYGQAVAPAAPGDPGEAIQVIVLVDERSASAAEMVAGALATQGRAVLIGTRSLGKGVGQQPFPVGAGLVLHITATQVLIDGDPYDGIGITPAVRMDEANPDLDRLLARAEMDDDLSSPADPDDDALEMCTSGPLPPHSDVPVELAQRLFANPIAYANALAQQQRVTPAHP